MGDQLGRWSCLLVVVVEVWAVESEDVGEEWCEGRGWRK